MKKLAAILAAALACSGASATDWTDCAKAYQVSPMTTYQGCLITNQHVPDLNPDETDGPLGFRYRRAKSKWCRVRAECPKIYCDGPLVSGGGTFGSRCVSGTYKATMVRATVSVKLGDAHRTRWCSAPPWKEWYLSTTCKD